MLWLEGNGFNKIQGLTHQTQLRTLYLHENIIEKIEGLETLKDLDLINLSNNFITKIENLHYCPNLTTLNIAHNRLSTKADIEHVLLLTKLQTLDLQHNKLKDTSVIDVLEAMPDLRVVYLMGNPFIKDIPHYRKVVIGRCKYLRYLDDRPVFEEERRRVDKWYEAFVNQNLEAAIEAEQQELVMIRKEKADAEERNFKAFEELMKRGQQIRREREASSSGALQSVNVNTFSGEPVIDVPESDVVRESRERRWGKDQPESIFDLATLATERELKLATAPVPSESHKEPSLNNLEDSPSSIPTVGDEVAEPHKLKGKFLGLLDEAMKEVSLCEAATLALD